MIWDKTAQSKLKEIMKDRIPTSDAIIIAYEAFGEFISRNSLISACKRYNIPLAPQKQKSIPRAYSTSKGKTKQPSRPAIIVAENPEGVHIHDLRPNMCCWPVSGAKPIPYAEFHYCGAPKIAKSYCAEHLERCYAPAKKKK